MLDGIPPQTSRIRCRGPEPRILVLVPHEPTLDPRVGWVTDLCAKVARTDVLAGVHQTKLPKREYDGRVYVERLPLQVERTTWESFLFHVSCRVGSLACTQRFRERQSHLLDEEFVPLGPCASASKVCDSFTERVPGQPAWSQRGVLRGVDHLIGGALHAGCNFLWSKALIEGMWRHVRSVSVVPRLVVCHDLFALVPAILLKRLHGCRVIYDCHESWPECDLLGPRWTIPYWAGFERRYIRQADAVVTVSTPLADHLKSRYGLKRIICVPNWTPWKKVVYPSCSRPLSFPVRFLLQGIASHGRGIEMLLSTWSRLADPRAVLYVRCPEGDYLAQLRVRYEEAVSKGLIVFLPAVTEGALVEAATFADVGIIPYPPNNVNHQVCCPNKLSQYMRAGLAILATDTQFVGEVLRRGDCGLTYDGFRAASLVQQVRAMCGDPARLQQMKLNAHHYGQENCAWENEAWRYRDLLKDFFCPPSATVENEPERRAAFVA